MVETLKKIEKKDAEIIEIFKIENELYPTYKENLLK